MKREPGLLSGNAPANVNARFGGPGPHPNPSPKGEGL